MREIAMALQTYRIIWVSRRWLMGRDRGSGHEKLYWRLDWPALPKLLGRVSALDDLVLLWVHPQTHVSVYWGPPFSSGDGPLFDPTLRWTHWKARPINEFHGQVTASGRRRSNLVAQAHLK